MKTQTIIWTALPHDFARNHRPRLSVFVSPRLRTDELLPGRTTPVLEQFPDFLAWPDKVRRLSFSVRIGNNPPFTVAPVAPAPESELWRDIFRPATPVRPHEFKDHTERVMHSFPVNSLLSYLRGVYTREGQSSPTTLPPVLPGNKSDIPPEATLAGLVNDLGSIMWQDRGRPALWERVLQERKVLDQREQDTHGFARQVQLDFAQLERFYNRRESKPPYVPEPDLALVPPSPAVPDLDFHQMLAALGDYPVLLRRLGLVIDLVLPPVEVAASTIRVLPVWDTGDEPAAFNKDMGPRTRYRLAGDKFFAEPRPDGDLDGRMVKLGGVNEDFHNEKFDLVQVDTDGVGLKALHFAGNMRRLFIMKDRGRAATNTPEEAGLPTLRSAGIAIARRNRAFDLFAHLKDALQKNQDAENAQPVTFFADDLVRGYRVDVFDMEAGQWFSLCQRLGLYRIVDEDGSTRRILTGAQGERIIADEGYVKGASTTSEDTATSDLYLHENVFRWDGWSLSAPRPGRTIRGERTGLKQDEKVERVAARAVPEKHIFLETEFKAQPGTLPRLRFGRAYRMRARTVDLSGYSESASMPDDAQATERLRYMRYDPVLPPAVVLRRPVTEGESIERMVIRSNFDVTAREYADASAARPDLQGKGYRADNERHLAAPKTSQLMAETHGLFDDSIGRGSNHERAFITSLKEAGTFFDDSIIDTTQPLDPVTGEPATVPVTGRKIITPPSVVNPATAPPLAPGQYVIHDTDQLALPYLPDYFARGAALRGLPGAGEGIATPPLETFSDEPLNVKVLKVPFTGRWPEALPFRICIVERPGKIVGHNCDESFEHTEDPPVWDEAKRLLTVFLAKAEVARVQYSCYLGADRQGRRDLRLMGIWRWLRNAPGAPDLERYADAGLLWMLTPPRELVLVHAVQQPLCAPRIVKVVANKNMLGDTHAVVTGKFRLSAKSTGKLDLHAEWTMPVDDLSEPGPKVVPGKAHVCERTVEEFHTNDLSTGSLELIKHEFGDTKHRLVKYHLQATTRFREYFPPEITSDAANISREGPKVEEHVENSARPAAPKVVYVMPTFKWEEQRAPDDENWMQVLRVRRGGGLRVYMERPWYSSGEGELLGVVLSPFTFTDTSDKVKPYVTNIGIDPLWSPTAATPSSLDAADFNNVAAKMDDLPLEELEFPNVKVAGFEPEYNAERQLWFCDIQFKGHVYAAYFPFVRLALARFQPFSITGAHLSRVVPADYAQLIPDRVLFINFLDDVTFIVSLVGYAPQGRSRRVELTIEAHDEKIPGEFGWSAVPAAAAQPNPARLAWGGHIGGQSTGPNFWLGRLKLPAKRGSQPFRLVIKEYESVPTDLPAGVSIPVAAVEPPKFDRLVYADTVVC